MAIDALIHGKQAERQARELAEKYNLKIVNVQYKLFPDGEHYLRITDPEIVKDGEVLIINTMYPRQNDSYLETLMLIDAVKRLQPRNIILVLLYLAYARQDKVFLPGEPVTGEIVVDTIMGRGVDRLFVIDIHSSKLIEKYGEKASNILVSDLLVEKALEYSDNPLILAPDKGALHRARFAAERHNLEYDYLVKHRDRVTGEVSIEPKEIDVRGRDVVIIDDIISTGGTIAVASRNMKKLGARRIYVAATHSLLVGNALNKIKSSGVEKIITGDTLGIKHSDPLIEYVTITSRIYDTIKGLG
jgi:ribose-phosphate pyrophosphokinase